MIRFSQKLNEGDVYSLIYDKRVLLMLKDKIAYIIIMIFIMMVYALNYYNPNIDRKYLEHTVDYTQYENYNENRLDGLIVENGVMTSTKDINFMVLGDRTILDEPIKTITLNVSYLSCEPVETKLYILDTYEEYDFILSEGKCNIVLANGRYLNDGDKPVLIRIDLLNRAGESVKVDSVVFNDKEICRDAALKDREDTLAQFALPIAMIIIAMYILKQGLTKNVPDSNKIFLFLTVLIIGIVIRRIFGDNILFYVAIGFSLLSGLHFVYYFMTKYVVDKLSNFKISFTTIACILCFILLGVLYFVKTEVFLLFAFYPLYLIGYYGNVNNKSLRYRKLIVSIGVLSCFVLFAVSFKAGSFFGAYSAVNSNGVKAFVLSVTFLSGLIAIIQNILSVSKLNIKKTEYVFPLLFAYCICILKGTQPTFAMIVLGVLISIIGYWIFDYFYPEDNYAIQNTNTKNNNIEIYIIKEVIIQICMIALLLFFESIVKYMLFDMSTNEVIKYIIKFIFTPVFAYNLLFINLVYFTIVFLLGYGPGSILFTVINFLLFIGNFIKLKYHDAMLKPGDLLQISDFLSIAENAIRLKYILIVFIILMLLFFAIFKLRKIIKKFIKPRLRILPFVITVVILLGICSYISSNKLNDIGITSVDKWLDDQLKTERQGFYIYTYYNILSIKDIIPSEPEGYSEETMKDIKNSFENISDNDIVGETKPDVIMLMMESVFDIENVPGIEFNEEIETNIKKYKTLDMISPRFGGGTANVEFEALTGLSSYFMPDNVVPYVTYWNNENDYIPSIAHQFKNNGYETVAIHPNNEKFYNRNIVYDAMGFDNFISIEDMPNGILRNKRSYVYDTEMLDIMTDEIEKNDAPKFMFALNIENHNPYDVKDANATVEITGDIPESDKNEAEIYSQTLKNDDQMIGDIIEYVNNTDRPTLLYIWGDHLPMLGVLSDTGYINTPENKYKTPVIMYSNYKKLEANTEVFTPNQFAPQVLKDSGIKYSSYFDFIYSLREKFPVIQREFSIDENSEEMKIYEIMQYDLLFGEGYLLSDE